MPGRIQLVLTLCLCATRQLEAGDWPQFLGPTRDGVYADSNLATWPKEGPPVVWQKSVGAGFSGPVVAAGQLILFQRLDDQEVVSCLDARTGEAKWTNGYA